MMTGFEPDRDVPLAPLSTLGVGGSAAWFSTARSAADVQRAAEWCATRSVPLFALGGGSNLVLTTDSRGWRSKWRFPDVRSPS